MKHLTSLTHSLVLAVCASSVLAGEEASVDEQMTALASMCADSASARADRHARRALYERLGGYDPILELTHEIVRRHQVNPDFEVMFRHIDGDKLARHGADFLAAGTGGTAEYTGRDLPAAHAHLRLTDADFLSAGRDVVGAMQHLGYGQEETDEVLCILVSLKDQVVFE